MNEVSKRVKRRLMQGVKAKCVDGRWSDGDGVSMPPEMLVVGMHRVAQCWRDGEVLDEYWEDDGPLPDIDDLNAQIPQAEWEIAFDKPRPPWGLYFVTYLVNPETADCFTFVSNSVGAKIAYERLVAKFEMMRRLRGCGVCPLVRLENRPMRIASRNITRLRPEFTVIEWRNLGGEEDKPAQLPPPTDPAADTVAKPPAEPATAVTAKPAAEKKKKVTVGKPVEPPTVEEELNDKIPDFI